LCRTAIDPVTGIYVASPVPKNQYRLERMNIRRYGQLTVFVDLIGEPLHLQRFGAFPCGYAPK
jgi:hypothetical protein